MKIIKSLYITIFLMLFFSPNIYAFEIYYGHGPYLIRGGFQGIAYSVADGLEHRLVHHVNRSKPILYTTFVELDNLNSSSTFGRLMGEQVASRFSQLGYRISELKLRNQSIVINEQIGETALTRDSREIKTNQESQAVIVGTYTVTNSSVIVSARVVSTIDNGIIASHDASFRLTQDLQKLLLRNSPAIKRNNLYQQTSPAIGPIARGSVLLDPKNSLAARLIQSRLAELNFYRDRIDGIWGKNSQAAMRLFKEELNIPAPTRWDLSTQIQLFAGTGQ